MGNRPASDLSNRPQPAASKRSVSNLKHCPVKSSPMKSPQSWGTLLLAALLVGMQQRAVEYGQLNAHNADWFTDVIAVSPSGPASTATVRAQARGHLIQLVVDARESERSGDSQAAFAAYSKLYVLAQDPELRDFARDALVARASTDWPKGYRSRFLTSLSPMVLTASRQHGVLPSITLAQAVLESGWGRSQLTRDYHNLFGVKAGSSSQRIRMASREHMRGRLRPSHQIFRRYESKAESIAAHAALLATDRRYAHARPHWTDRHRFLASIAPRYASSPTYPDAVNEIIDLYKLDRWDALIVEAVENDLRLPPAPATADAATEPDDEASDTGLPPLDG